MLHDENKVRSLNVHLPTYDRSRLKHGIVHLGVGAFHRAHLAYYMDLLASDHQQTDWGICGVGVRIQDKGIADALQSQDGLYTLVSRGEREQDIRIVGSLIKYLFAPDSPEAVLDAMSHPDTRIISLTITERGYTFTHEDNEMKDLDPANASAPQTVFGYIIRALERRQKANLPVTILSCDNLMTNGEVTKRCVLSLVLALEKPDLASWIEKNVTFPSSMVDRITPATTEADRAFVFSCGLKDGWPVTTEPFIQWVVEDNFAAGRPPLELLKNFNVVVTQHVQPYELMKIHLLNATHSCICYFGRLAGYRYIDEIMADPDFATYAERFMDEEVTPTLPSVPGIDLCSYKKALIVRFSNSHIKDTASRVCQDGASKLPKFLLPTVRAQLAANKSIHFSTLAIASWLRFLQGKDESDVAFGPLEDSLAVKLHLSDIAKVTPTDASKILLAAKDIFGDLVHNEKFVQSVQMALWSFYERGAKATLTHWLCTPELVIA